MPDTHENSYPNPLQQEDRPQLTPRIPLVEDLANRSILPGSNILVEFDPCSQWYNASLTIAAGWHRSGGKVSYIATVHEPDCVRERLRILGLTPAELEAADRLWITDAYTAGTTTGQKSKERFHIDSLKVADLSIWVAKEALHEEPDPDFLIIDENTSVMDRFNEEEHWVELLLSRLLPMAKERRITQFTSLLREAHSEWLYKQLEAAVDSVVDFRLDEQAGEARDMMRVRSMWNAGFDRRWHTLSTLENFEVTLQK